MQHLAFWIGQLESKVAHLEKETAQLREEIAQFRGRARRVGVLILLALMGALTNSGPQGAEVLADALKLILH